MSKREQGMHKDILDRMIEIRRHLHRHPELSNEEAKTQAYLKQALEQEGLAGVREVAGYGLAVDIIGKAQASNRKVAIRADIDALPILEESGVEFSSSIRASCMPAAMTRMRPWSLPPRRICIAHVTHSAVRCASSSSRRRRRNRWAAGGWSRRGCSMMSMGPSASMSILIRKRARSRWAAIPIRSLAISSMRP